MQERIQGFIEEARKFIAENYRNLDLQGTEELCKRFLAELKSQIKPSEELLAFFQDKMYFRAAAELQEFASRLFNAPSPFSKRIEIERDLAIKCMQRKIGVEKLVSMVGPPKPAKKKPAAKKSSKTTKPIEDQVKRWMLMPLKTVEAELNDLNKYPDIKALKMAGNSILKEEEKRGRRREAIVKSILSHLAEEQSILKLGT